MNQLMTNYDSIKCKLFMILDFKKLQDKLLLNVNTEEIFSKIYGKDIFQKSNDLLIKKSKIEMKK